tara:strand:+ start:800 stop:1075 length:276 start_codon:yes stop_codon:yes gene_type:complete
MTVTKKEISKKLAIDLNISIKESESLVNNFINQIKNNSKNEIVKIHNFGTFFYKYTKERIGRNPKTKKLYKIKSFRKLAFKPSNSLKNDIN